MGDAAEQMVVTMTRSELDSTIERAVTDLREWCENTTASPSMVAAVRLMLTENELLRAVASAAWALRNAAERVCHDASHDAGLKFAIRDRALGEALRAWKGFV